MRMPLLTAPPAIILGHCRAATEAMAVMSGGQIAGGRLDSRSERRARHCLADPLQPVHDSPAR